MSLAEAATAILGQTLTLSRTVRLALKTTARLAESARCYRFVSGSVPASVAMIQQLIASPVFVSSQQPRG